jgi:hypothetical protein
MGSLYLQKNTLTSFLRTAGRLWMMSKMLRSATYCTSGPDDNRVTSRFALSVLGSLKGRGYFVPNGGPIFLQM